MNDKAKTIPDISERLEEGDDRMDRLEKAVEGIQNDLSELLNIFRATKGFFKVWGWIGKGVLKLSAISIALVGLYHLAKHLIHK